MYVVEVKGDRLDPAHVRAAVGRELGAATIAPDDPRAGSAAGVITLETNTADGSLVVRFQKHASPVQRSTRLPEDPARAETTAVYLAGNLARDDAKALLDALTPPAAKAAKIAADAETAHDDEDLRILRLTLDSKSEEEKTRTRSLFAGGIVLGVGALTGGVALEFRGANDFTKGTGALLTGAGIWTLAVAIDSVIIGGPSFPAVAEKLTAATHEGGSSTEALARVDHDWAIEANRAHKQRIIEVVLCMIAAAAGVTLGTVFANQSSEARRPDAGFAFGAAAVAAGVGVYTLASKSTTEAEYDAWRKVRAAPDRAARLEPRFGLSPLKGGAAATFGFSF